MTFIAVHGEVSSVPIASNDSHSCMFRIKTTGPAEEPITTTVAVVDEQAQWLLTEDYLHPGTWITVHGHLSQQSLTGSYIIEAKVVAFDAYRNRSEHD